ncbi:thymidine kinase [Alkalicoccobacillus gibsonii]|uniref:thymidine kinase n=1 Tax=Alkalicoccobacillus gibsonii TaxID=79881 RepID=UPI0035150FFA
MQITPKLTVIVGGMFSGKSTELQRQGKRHMLQGHNVYYVKPRTDNRYSKDEIVTHEGTKVDCISIESDGSIIQFMPFNTDVVLIDEVQFFSDRLLGQIEVLLRSGIRVYCSGLDMDFEGRPYGITPYLMALADEVNKLHAVCDKCGNDAYVTPRKVDNKEQLLVGSSEYYPLCRSCFYEKERQTC